MDMESPSSQVATLPKDLKVTILSSCRVYPSECERQQRGSMFLSNIDQVLNFSVETVHFFAANPEFPPAAVAEKLKSALEKLLVPYEFLAGRLQFNQEEGRMEIDCNAAGAGFVVAASELELDELGQLEYPNPAFRQLAVTEPPDALFVLQVTSFKCNSFALGVANNHTTFDGISFQIFLQNLASLLFNKPLAITPCIDRRLLAARSPPCIAFPHSELIKLDIPPSLHSELPPPSTLLNAASDDLEVKLFHLSPGDISTLKSKVKMDLNDINSATTITSFSVVTAHLWRCKALATTEVDRNKTSTILYAVDLRPRLRPPLPRSYTGNAVLSAVGVATCRELEEGPFASIVDIIQEGAKSMDDDYARSVIDWGQLYKGFPHGDVLVSSWWRLGFAEVEYPWGKPKYTCPVVYTSRDIVLLFPAIGGVNKGVNVVVALPHEDMGRFSTLFYKLQA